MNTKKDIGIYHKYEVKRTDGSSDPGEKHDGCEYFVLDLTHDKFAAAAIAAYAHACREEYPQLAIELLDKSHRMFHQLQTGGLR